MYQRYRQIITGHVYIGDVLLAGSFYYGMMQLQRKIKVEKFLGGVNRQEKNPDSQKENGK